MKESSKIYPHVIPEINDWPINKLLADRKNLIQELNEFTYQRLAKLHGDDLPNIIARTIYLERIRIKEEPWKVDPPNERLFWKKVGKKLFKNTHEKTDEEKEAIQREVLYTIINRYSEEIVATFQKPTFLFARRFLKVFFNRLLNTAAGRNMKRVFGTKHKIEDRLLTRGEIEKIRGLIKKGTVVIVPTHSSNLDSILIGYAMDALLGLPSFAYGAGLNLYNTGYTAYFMNRIGTYRVDRRKKNPVYLETLKGMSQLSIEKGTNSLFFPGGTRSRSGELESKLKMGLLGTAIRAQRKCYQEGKDNKVFIVPLIISYHVVLEAKFLIEQHLQRTGKEKYLKSKDHFHSFRKLLKFGWNFFSRPSEITLSFGKPMDILGNFVDEEGLSLDRQKRPLDPKEYFISNGKVVEDNQREMEYTKILAQRIEERYAKENIILTSHLVAHAAFIILQKENANLDIYALLRLPPDEFVFSYEKMKNIVGQLKTELIKMEKKGRVKLSGHINLKVDKLIKDGVQKIGIYHPEKTLLFNKKGELVSKHFNLLYFYYNRLTIYDLKKKIVWEKEPANRTATKAGA